MASFTEVAASASVGRSYGQYGVAWGDFNGDGFMDVYIPVAETAGGKYNGLFQNNGDGTFTDVTPANMYLGSVLSISASWVDYDADGDLDLYVLNYGANALFRNDGGLTFTDVATNANLNSGTKGRSGVWADIDADEDLDLFITSETPDSDQLFKGNAGVFVSIFGSGVTGNLNTEGAAWADFDGDGDLDLCITNPAAIYQNDGTGAFTSMGIAATANCRSCSWGDYDNDGDLDLYVTVIGGDNLLYRNNAGTSFTEVGVSAKVDFSDNCAGANFPPISENPDV